MNTKNTVLTELQHALCELLIMRGVQEDALVGTMLLLKDSIPDQEEMLLFLWDNKPSQEEIDEKLIEIVMRRPLSQRCCVFTNQNNNIIDKLF